MHLWQISKGKRQSQRHWTQQNVSFHWITVKNKSWEFSQGSEADKEIEGWSWSIVSRRLGNPEAAMKCFESALEARSDPFCSIWPSASPKVDSKMNLASKNLGAIYGSMGRMVR